ncbi:MAG: UDP-N-acetylmuramoyl-tripeptide--D-alanyl-D-alanine ligase [Anaerolineales bacterium]|nr:UDP-N-acetylmuramoyl-tripeptide--D-alanyl-D-alanine ligase [Anaerolineales bacterium]
MNPLVIGITGSYGKTSTKHLIAEILTFEYSEFEVLSTPRSYNTLMGVCKVINESLKPHHKYFVVEMGAYKSGEIKKICQLVKPQIGILTAIGPQHLERFKTIENVARAKNELIEALPDNGVAIFNGDDPFCQKLAAGAKARKLFYGTASNENFDIKAANISMSIKGTEFDIELKSEKPRHVKMQLLGHHNVSNALGAILVARECGVPVERAVRALLTINPFEHRMQLIRTPQGITVIDNAYNSNPVSAKISLDVMQAIQTTGRKILVTPGFAELGVRQDEEHFKLGQNAASVCDYVFLVGDDKRVTPIVKGLTDQGFAQERIYVNRSLAEARRTLAEVSSPGDLILFENDLPDIY